MHRSKWTDDKQSPKIKKHVCHGSTTRPDISCDSDSDNKQSPRTPKTARLPWCQQQERVTRKNIKPGRADISCDSGSDDEQSPRTPNTWNRSTEIYVTHKKITPSSKYLEQQAKSTRRDISPDISPDEGSARTTGSLNPLNTFRSRISISSDEGTTPRQSRSDMDSARTSGSLNPLNTFRSRISISSDEGTTQRQSLSDMDSKEHRAH